MSSRLVPSILAAQGYENGTHCPYVLTSTLDVGQAELHAAVAPEKRLREWTWAHPDQGLSSIIVGFVLGTAGKIHRERVRYAGSWTMILGHEQGWVSGADAARSVVNGVPWSQLRYG